MATTIDRLDWFRWFGASRIPVGAVQPLNEESSGWKAVRHVAGRELRSR